MFIVGHFLEKMAESASEMLSHTGTGAGARSLPKRAGLPSWHKQWVTCYQSLYNFTCAKQNILKTNMTTNSDKHEASFKISLLLPGAFIALLFAFISLEEWYQVGWLATPSIIAQYPFGGEGPAGDDWHYLNAHRYACVELLNGLLMLGVLFTFGFAIRMLTFKTAIIAYALLFIAFLVHYAIISQPIQ